MSGPPASDSEYMYLELPAGDGEGLIRVRRFDVLDSTQAYILRNMDICSDYEVIVAKIQTSGRGRAKNRWYSTEGCLMFSMKITSSKVPNVLYRLAQIAKETLEGLGVPGLSVKWPNDVYVTSERLGRPAKVVGILADTFENRDEFVYVIGIGINMHGGGGAYASIEEATGVRVSMDTFLTHFVLGAKERIHTKQDLSDIFGYKFVVLQDRPCEIIGMENDGLLVLDGGKRRLIEMSKYKLDYETHKICEK